MIQSIVNRCGVIAGAWQFGEVDQGVAALWVMAHHFKRPLSYIGYRGSETDSRPLKGRGDETAFPVFDSSGD
jgi:CDP-paratose 2-epimerase